MEDFTPGELEIISELEKKLYEELELLHSVSQSLQVDLHNDDPEAKEMLQRALRHAKHEFREIGFELDAYGGFKLMQNATNKISRAGFSIVVIEHAWNGIGTWVV